MPRSNRPRRGRSQPEPPGRDLGAMIAGFKRVEDRRDGSWWVQPVSAASAIKVYRCPGCGRDVEEGVPHLVTWRADGIMGDASDLAARRHWHTHCWRQG